MRRKLFLRKYRTARNRVKEKKLGVFPLVDSQGIFAVYLMHKKIRVLQHICDHILKIPRYYIHRKPWFMYIKLTGCHADKWVKYMKENNWKRDL